jgi:hypothetical protein
MTTHPGYETSDANVGRVVLITVVLGVVVTCVLFGVTALMGSFERSAAERASGLHPLAVDAPPPGPQLQADPAAELAEHRALELRRTSEYAWVDAERGIVRIPVEHAMELIAERGVPSREKERGEVR